MTELHHIKSKALNGSVWAIIEKFSLQIVQFIVGVILARLLEPKDYGLIAITMIFTSISAAITDGGFEKTLIRKETLTPIEIDSVFYINLVLGLLLALGLFLSASLIAAFFNEASLTPVLKVTSLSLVLTALIQTQRALLMKELHFKKISISQIFSSIIGGLAGIVMAYRGWGVWSLVYSALLSQVIALFFFWIGSDWYPKLDFSFSAIREMLPYGSRILVSSILFFLMLQFNSVVIGKFFTKPELGFFNRGSRLPEFIISILQSVVLKMVFPLLAKVLQDENQFLRMVRKAIKIVGFITVPLLTLVLLQAHEITLVLFTSKWEGSVFFLELFCLIRIFEPFITIYRELILARGHARLLLRFFIISSVIEITGVLVVIPWGIHAVIYVTLLSKFGQYLIYMLITSRHLVVSWKKQLYWISPYFLISLPMALVVKGMAGLLAHTPLVSAMSLSITLLCGMGFYLLLASILGFEEMKIVRELLKEFERRIFFRRKKEVLNS